MLSIICSVLLSMMGLPEMILAIAIIVSIIAVFVRKGSKKPDADTAKTTNSKPIYTPQPAPDRDTRSLQGGKYRIKKKLGQGGFGITYLAEHTLLGADVAIKEFFVKDLSSRDTDTGEVTLASKGSIDMVSQYKEKFIKEARNIYKLNHPNIIHVLDVFEENGTAYYVMDLCQGGSLEDLLQKHPSGINETLALCYIRQIASALQYLHEQKMNHLDVKPANILLNAKGEAVLADFGLSKHYNAMGDQTTSTPVGISQGYAPMEQYNVGGVVEFSPSTDIYSLGATLFKLITGQTPPAAHIVVEEGVPTISANISINAAIQAAMQFRKKDRPQSIEAFLSVLDNNGQSYPIHETITNGRDEEETCIVTGVYNGSEVECNANTYILVNKAKGPLVLDDILSKQSDLNSNKTICKENIIQIGNFEEDATGLIILTNDKDLSSTLLSPMKLIYHVWFNNDIEESDLYRIANGLELEDGRIYADAIAYAGENIKNQIGIEIHSCKKNIIHRIFNHLGYKIKELELVYLAGLTKRNLPLGQCRNLSEDEIVELKSKREC